MLKKKTCKEASKIEMKKFKSVNFNFLLLFWP
jgi:hypothetical protein